MLILTVLLAILFSIFATAIMSYISMATGIGPWIETTLVLAGMLMLYGAHRWYTSKAKMQALGLLAATGGIGGILATACGFSFPTFYFLDPEGFTALLNTPWQFAGQLSLIAFSAGTVGLLAAHYFEHALMVQQELPFPIGELVFKMITVADDLRKALMLAVGFVGTKLFLIVRSLSAFLAQPLVLFNEHTFGPITLPSVKVVTDQLPMFWAIGFITGHVIALPLLVGMITKICIINPLHSFYPSLYHFVYDHGYGALSGLIYVPKILSRIDFTIAFCSGLVLYGAVKGFIGLPRILTSLSNKLFKAHPASAGTKKMRTGFAFPWYIMVAIMISNIGILSYFMFSWTAQIYILVFTFVSTYQLMLIAGKFGLAPLGRFATFVMVPGVIIFGFNPLQTTFVATYVEIAGGVACDALFGRKMAQLASIDRRTICRYQWLGLCVSVMVIGVLFWGFITHFGLGNQVGALAVTRSASRAFLISIKSFDLGALGLGLIFGYLISYLNINAALLLGGILMPIDYTLLLVLGGFSTYLVDDKEEYYPFWSGVFAANSLWMLLRVFR